jgi:hypothetical protein
MPLWWAGRCRLCAGLALARVGWQVTIIEGRSYLSSL